MCSGVSFGVLKSSGLVIVNTEVFVATALSYCLLKWSVSWASKLEYDSFPAWVMSYCKSLIGFPNGTLMLAAAAPAAEDGAAAPVTDAPIDGKH